MLKKGFSFLLKEGIIFVLLCLNQVYAATTSEITVTVTVVSLQAPRVLKEVDKSEAKRGEIITYTIKYDNDTPLLVEDLVIVDEIPIGTVYVTDSAEIDNQPHLPAQVTVWYFDGSSWQDSNWDNQEENKPLKIRWIFTQGLGVHNNSEGTDTPTACDGEFADTDSGILKFRVRVE